MFRFEPLKGASPVTPANLWSRSRSFPLVLTSEATKSSTAVQQGGASKDFGLFNTWNAFYADGRVPWDPEYRGGKLLGEEAYVQNYAETDAVEEMGWDYIWRGGGHFSKQASMDPQVLLLSAVIAERTKRIKIGSSIHRPVMRQSGETVSESALPHERYGFDNLMREDPFQTAEQVAIVD